MGARNVSQVKLFGYSVELSTKANILEQIKHKAYSRKAWRVLTLNPEIVVGASANPVLLDWTRKSDCIVADGQGICWATKVLLNKKLTVTTGIDLVYDLIKQPELSIYFVGATQQTIDLTVKAVQKEEKHAVIAGYHHGYFKEDQVPTIVQDIIQSKATVVLVALGFPKQEQFIQQLDNKNFQGVTMGVGGSFDVVSGTKMGAPVWIRRVKCEWFYRGLQSPRRILRWGALWRFVIMVLKEKRALNQQA